VVRLSALHWLTPATYLPFHNPEFEVFVGIKPLGVDAEPSHKFFLV